MTNFEKPLQKQKELPVGKAKELSSFTQKHWREHLVLFSQVKNRVIEVNPNIYFPLKMEEGKPSPLGLFAEAAFQEEPPKNIPEGKRVLETWAHHQRSALLGRALFADKEGRIYRDIDLKGVGYIFSKLETESPPDITKPGGTPAYGYGSKAGFLDKDIALFDRQMSEDFLRAGIRTHRVLGTIALEEIIVDGEKISLAEARRQGLFSEDFQPVVEVRGFGTKTRLQDMITDAIKKNLLFRDAKKLVSQELGRKKTLSDTQYAEWLAKMLGKNIGLMHKNGWQHDFINSHNITLDCRIVDLDAVSELVFESQRQKDFDGGERVLRIFTALNDLLSKRGDHYSQLFRKSYDKVFPPEARKRYFAEMAKRPQAYSLD